MVFGIFRDKNYLKVLGAKIGVFGLVIFCLIPFSMKISNAIDETYNETIEATISGAEETTNEINESTDKEGNIITNALNAITGGIAELVKKGEDNLNRFIESIAVMLVSSCLIPIGVLFL